MNVPIPVPAKTRIERLRIGPLGENVYAVESGDTAVLIDPGDEPTRILDFLVEKHIEPTIVVLTHGHLDHVAALPELLEAWKNRQVHLAIHTADASYLGTRGEETNRALFEAIRAMGFFRNYWRDLPESDLLLEEGMLIPGTRLRVMHTPGHSAGSICLFEEEAGFLVSGDTLFRDGIGRTDGPDSDPEAMQRSLKRLSKFPPETVVFPGHGPRTTIGRELGNLR